MSLPRDLSLPSSSPEFWAYASASPPAMTHACEQSAQPSLILSVPRPLCPGVPLSYPFYCPADRTAEQIPILSAHLLWVQVDHKMQPGGRETGAHLVWAHGSDEHQGAYLRTFRLLGAKWGWEPCPRRIAPLFRALAPRRSPVERRVQGKWK